MNTETANVPRRKMLAFTEALADLKTVTANAAVVPAHAAVTFAAIEDAADAAFTNRDAEASHLVHGALFAIYVSGLEPPWTRTVGLAHDSMAVIRLRLNLEAAWERGYRERYSSLLSNLPGQRDFKGWVLDRVRSHRSNVQHPLFDFLEKQANREQLREFIRQETPFDIHFADLITLMMPGVYGAIKVEMASNFWDEMGQGVQSKMHITLRLQMMDAIGLSKDDHLTSIDEYAWEELALANTYFDAAVNRRKLGQMIGMMLATEVMVPGRLDRQIHGWRRVGLADKDMEYLIDHTVVDIRHADGWMNEVVLPLVEQHQDIIEDLVIGVERRLDMAGAVCDCMLNYLPCTDGQPLNQTG